MQGRRGGVAPCANTQWDTTHPSGIMSIDTAEMVASALQGYAAAGLLFAVPFLAIGAARVDEHLAGSPRAVRALILPGVVIFWPLLAWRWLTGAQAPVEQNPHRRVAASRSPRR